MVSAIEKRKNNELISTHTSHAFEHKSDVNHPANTNIVRIITMSEKTAGYSKFTGMYLLCNCFPQVLNTTLLSTD